MWIVLKRIKFSFTHYKILNLESNATSEEIRKRYYQLAKQNHPDMNNSDQETFLKIKQAYDVLINPSSRAIYDQKINVNQTNKDQFYEYAQHHSSPQRNRFLPVFNLILGLFGIIIGYEMFSKYLKPMTEHQIRRQNIMLANENIDSSPSAQERRRQQYAEEVKQKKIRAKVVELKVGNGGKQSTKSKQKRKNSLASLEGVQKEVNLVEVVESGEQYM